MTAQDTKPAAEAETAGVEALERLEALAKAATPGPWAWFGNSQTRQIHLATPDRGRQYIMAFDRWGMGGAQPTFRRGGLMARASEICTYAVGDGKAVGHAAAVGDESVYRYDINGLDSPDAAFIAAANPATVLELIALARRAAAAEARTATFESAAREVDRWLLVIESAVRTSDPGNRAGVLAALDNQRALLTKDTSNAA
jgi:hypothetical protein